jgi:hypothetical protein
MRNLDPVFQVALEQLEPIFERFGFKLASECHHPESFGSAHAEYRRRGLRLRLVWDGKDRWLWVQYARSAGDSMPREQDYLGLETAADAATNRTHTTPPEMAGARVRELATRLEAFLNAERAA